MQLNIFKTLNQVKELETEKTSLLTRLEQAQKDLTDAQDVIGTFMTEKKTFDTQLADVQATAAAKVLEIETATTAKISDMQKEYEAKLVALEVQVADVKNSSNKEAAAIVASIGIEPEAIKTTATVDTNILGTFEKLTGKEKNEFYQKNREAILKATGWLSK